MTKVVPVAVVTLAVIILWYVAAYFMNAPQAIDLMDPADTSNIWLVIQAAFSMDRPVLPTPDQILGALYDSIFNYPLTSPRNFLLQTGYTATTAIAGLGLGLVFGLLLAIGIVYSRVLDRALMPWIIGSQTVPILAIAPMVIVALGNIGMTGLAPKALIVGYLCFFPITVGMVKGFRSVDPLHLDLMQSYDASSVNIFFKLRLPISMSFLFPSLKVAAALSVTGAIVAELPTGAVNGLGSRLLAGSYYGQTMMIWDALLMASVLALVLIGCGRLAELMLTAKRGGRL